MSLLDNKKMYFSQMILTKAPRILQRAYPGLTWHGDRTEPRIFLTFDDGPIPDVTEEIVSLLDSFAVKATFFCVGENIVRHPEVFDLVKSSGHRIGNHTYNHLNGWKTPDSVYLANVQRCEALTGSGLFRPPYSKIRRSQAARLRTDYEIIMWDVISRDYDPRFSPEQCLRNVLRHAGNGSIVVFHDHVKAADRVRYALPRAIETWLERGFEFGVL